MSIISTQLHSISIINNHMNHTYQYSYTKDIEQTSFKRPVLNKFYQRQTSDPIMYLDESKNHGIRVNSIHMLCIYIRQCA